MITKFEDLKNNQDVIIPGKLESLQTFSDGRIFALLELSGAYIKAEVKAVRPVKRPNVICVRCCTPMAWDDEMLCDECSQPHPLWIFLSNLFSRKASK